MKVLLTYKSPDVLDYAIDDVEFEGDRFEIKEQKDNLRDELIEILGDTEYLTVEVDTETKTVKVVK